ncbi:MAG TPA: asparagine synthase (glutamine-hydrolyzing) [Gemmatimonadaceae bacterium]|nr:asparagine synthase (glutamine-hydrolyzing) [Gemmatimonadaceae bacterium]
MCGILALIRDASEGPASTTPLIAATRQVRHRGPDDEGFLLWQPGDDLRALAGEETSDDTIRALRLTTVPASAHWRVALGHRRLSIVDLSPGGHQPMIERGCGLAIAYNGEIYNHIELRAELERQGREFHSHSDTEVLLAAWAEWGVECLNRLNGMFSFVLLDTRGAGKLHAVRDRFGVKPLYLARVGELFALASEIKQIRALPGYSFELNEGAAADYLGAGLMDHTRDTFDAGIEQLLGGEMVSFDLGQRVPQPRVERWYTLRRRSFHGSDADAAMEFRRLLTDSVRLRLRADVPVGSCLSGGLDSSAIVALARENLEAHGDHQGQITVTARYSDPRFDEWVYAEQVIRQTQARSVEVWPTVERLRAEVDRQIWYLDAPFGSTSQFSQWCVFAAAADAGLKVMLDGQGSDEQLAGYNGNDAALYTGQLRRGALVALTRELRAAILEKGALPKAPLLFAIRNTVPALDLLLPGRLRVKRSRPAWLRLDAPFFQRQAPARGLGQSLIEQTLSTSLPVLLRYEDRNSMARSIESRVPFLDYRLVEFLAGLPDHLKLREGVTKVVLREGLRGVIPESVRTRRDKMGFVTPEQVWLREKATAWFRREIAQSVAQAPSLFVADEALDYVDDIIAGRAAFSFDPWRMLCMGRWLAQVRSGQNAPPETEPVPLQAVGA